MEDEEAERYNTAPTGLVKVEYPWYLSPGFDGIDRLKNLSPSRSGLKTSGFSAKDFEVEYSSGALKSTVELSEPDLQNPNRRAVDLKGFVQILSKVFFLLPVYKKYFPKNIFSKSMGNHVLTTFGEKLFFETKFFARFFSSSDVIVEKYFWWKNLRWKKNRRKNCIFKKFKNIFWVDSACPPRWLFWKCHLNYWIEPGHTL